MEEEVVCYKVVKLTRKSGRRLSAIITGPAQIEYGIGVWNKPHAKMSSVDQDICVFMSEERAHRFAKTSQRNSSCYEYQIWKCLGRGLHDPKIYISPVQMSRRNASSLDKILGLIAWRTWVKSSFVDGTMMVKEIMFVERVRE